MSIDGLDIPSLLLDPENEEEVIEQAYERIRTASGGTISDFNPSSPIAALIEGQAYVYVELLWYLNQLPEALALEVLRLSGVSRSIGTKARGSLTFLLQAPVSADFIVNSGFVVPFKDSGYQTTATLVIPAGALEGQVTVEAIREGADLNLAAFGLTSPSVGLSYLQSIYNTEPVTGGTDLEPLPETLRRAQAALRSREVLVTVEDYETKSQELLGVGSTATAYALLTSNKMTEQVGNLHVFLADSAGNPPSPATCSSIQAQLNRLSFAGSTIWVSPVDLQKLSIDVVVKTDQISQEIADFVFSALKDYLSPASFQLGSTVSIRELEYVARTTAGVTEVISLLVNGKAVNQAMPNKYTQPVLDVLSINANDPTGLSYTFYLT